MRLLDKAGSFSLTVQDGTPPYRYVSVEGPVVGAERGITFPQAEAIAARYLDGEALTRFLASLDLAAIVEVRMRPERWFSSDEAV